MNQKLFLFLYLIFQVIYCSSSKRARGGRQLDLDAIIEGRLSNHVIGERQSRNLKELDKNVTSLNSSNSTDEIASKVNKTGRLIDEEESMQKHASFISHYASEEELAKSELRKSIENLDHLMETSARVVNNMDLYPQGSSVLPITYLNPIYPNEDKILAALINQAASNIANGQSSSDQLSTMQSNPSPIYANNVDKSTQMNNQQNGGLSSFLNIGGNGNNNKKKPFASISSSLQEFAASILPNRVTNRFIKRKQSSGQSVNQQLDYANFANECTCVPFYMCRSGYIEESSVKKNTAGSPSLSQFDQKKQTGVYEPSVYDLVEGSSGLSSVASSLEKYYNTQDMLAAASLIQQNGYSILNPSQNNQPQLNNNFKFNSQQTKDNNQEKIQNLSKPQTIDKRTQIISDNFSDDSQQNKKLNTNLESLPIDERSIDGNSTEGILEVSLIENKSIIKKRSHD